MKRQHRVVWSKGMFLSSQHFQAQDQYFEDEFRFRCAVTRYSNWGVTELEVDEDGIENRTFRVTRCAGVMPDGLAFSLGGSEKAPDGRSFEKLFKRELDQLDVYLALPERQIDGLNISQAEGPALRYLPADIDFTDEYDGQEEPIQVAQPNFRVVFGAEATEGMTLLQIGQIKRVGGHIRMNPQFIPPCLGVGVSEHVMDRLVPTLLDALKLVSTKLAGTRGEASEYLADFSESDIVRFWVLDMANRALPELKHLWSISGGRDADADHPKAKRFSAQGLGVHPEDLYRLLLRLAGGLCTFSTEVGPLNFPEYDHKNLGKCFSEITDKIERMLKSIVYPPSKFAKIMLTPLGNGEWKGDVEASYFRLGRFYLALRVNSGSMDLVRFVEVEKKVKICGETVYPDLKARALEGARLQYERRPPRGLPGRVGSEYFRVMPGSIEWNDVEETKKLRILVRPNPPDPAPEMYVVEMFVLLE